jgi:hypothetical protein
MVDGGDLHSEDGRPGGVWVWRALQPWRHMDTGDGRHGQVLVLAGGRPTLTATPITDGPPTATWPRPSGARSWQGPAGRPRPFGAQATRGDPAHARRCRHRRCHPQVPARRQQRQDPPLRRAVQRLLPRRRGRAEPEPGRLCGLPRSAVLVDPSPTATSGALHAQQRVGWQPSRFLTDRAEAERAFRLAEGLGSVNAAAVELGTTWASLRKAFARHGLGMPARNPEAVRQRAIDTARQRSGRPATPSLDPVFVALNHGELPVRGRSGGELAERVRRAEDTQCWAPGWWWSCTAKATPPSPAPAPGRSPAAPTAPTAARSTASSAATATVPTVPAAPTDPINPRRGDIRRCPLTRPAATGQVVWRSLRIQSCLRRSRISTTFMCTALVGSRGSVSTRSRPRRLGSRFRLSKSSMPKVSRISRSDT